MKLKTMIGSLIGGIILTSAVAIPANAALTTHVTNHASRYSDTGVILHGCTPEGKIFGPASIAEPGQKKRLNYDYNKSKGRVCVYVPAKATAIVTDYWLGLHSTKNVSNNTSKGKDMLVPFGDVGGDRIYTNIVLPR